MNYQVDLLKMGQSDVPGPEVYWMRHWDEWLTLYFYMVVIRGGGHTIIVNTGPPQDLTDINHQWASYAGPRCQLLRQDNERPEPALAALGLSPEQVDYVLITPLQSYATGNIPLFRNAQICVSRRGWIEDFHAPKFPLHSPRRSRIPDDVLTYLDIEAPDKVRLLSDEEEILPGLHCFWTGVHHRSSMAYCMESAKGTVVVTDAAFHYGNIEKSHPLGILESMEECNIAYARIRRRAKIVIPLYDPDALRRHPSGRVA
jgi:glyoxylase-like metal-dependent hydrolase (beta-lactamase superfamily II)